MIQWGLGTHTEDLVRLGLEAARRAIALDPKLAEGYKAEALVLRASGNTDAANVSLRRAVELNPRLTAAWINLGVHAFEKCDVAGAERSYRRALDLDPQEAFALAWLSQVLLLTGRPEEALAAALSCIRNSSNVFHTRGGYICAAAVHLRRGDLVAARQTLTDARGAGVTGPPLQIFEAIMAGRAGRWDQAGRLLTFAEPSLELGPPLLGLAIEISLARGERARALGFARRPIFLDISAPMVRLNPALHTLLDEELFAPRRSARTLVWPAEAPPVPPEIAELFADVRVESGKPSPTGT
jgi:tetratricopeptide (TPR) repeat protein